MVKWIPCCFAGAFSTLAWARARETCNWLMSTSLPSLSGAGVRAATARGVPILHSGLEGIFPTDLIPPNTELRGGKGIGSSTVTTPGTFKSFKPVAHMFLRGGISCGMGCHNCLRRLVARMSPCLRLAPTVPAGSRVARKYDPLLLRGNVRFAPIMCIPGASGTIRCGFWDGVQRIQVKS